MLARTANVSRKFTPVEEAAALWVTRCHSGLSSSEEEEFQNWLCADPSHAALFEEIKKSFDRFDAVRDDALLTNAPLTPAAFAPPGENETIQFPHAARRRWATLPWAAALAAAALAIGYFTWWRPAHFTDGAATQIGRQQTMKLPDGSRIELNTDSVVTIAYTPDERRIRLAQGEAHFSVAKNPNRPFVVEANGVAVRAVGTAFNVRLRESAKVEILVTEGKVQVNDLAQGRSLLPVSVPELPQVLSAGERVVVTAQPVADAPAPAVATLAPDEIKREVAWRSGLLQFEPTPLAQIVEEFNRYNTRKLVIADPTLAAKTFGGSFQVDDPERFVRMLRENYPVQTEERDNQTILRLAK